MEKGLLYFLNGNIQMAMLSTKKVIEISDDEKLRSALLEDLHSLEKFENAVINLRGETYKDKIKGLTNMARRGTEMAIDMKTFMSKDRDKLCCMLATGYEKGIADLNRSMRKAENEREEVVQLAEGYMTFMRRAHAKYKGI